METVASSLPEPASLRRSTTGEEMTEMMTTTTTMTTTLTHSPSRLTVVQSSVGPSVRPLIIGELRARQSHSHDRFDCGPLLRRPLSLYLSHCNFPARPRGWPESGAAKTPYRMPNYPLTGGTGNGNSPWAAELWRARGRHAHVRGRWAQQWAAEE